MTKTGLTDWEDAGLLAQVLAASQQEYLDRLKKNREAVDTPEAETDPAEHQPHQDQPAESGRDSVTEKSDLNMLTELATSKTNATSSHGSGTDNT